MKIDFLNKSLFSQDLSVVNRCFSQNLVFARNWHLKFYVDMYNNAIMIPQERERIKNVLNENINLNH